MIAVRWLARAGSALLPLASAASGQAPPAKATSSVAGAPVERFEFAHASMGTRFRIVLYAGSGATARAAVDAAFARIDELDARLSDYRSDSELRRLERAAALEATSVGDDLWTVLVEARCLARGTRGAFDVTVGALTRLWRWAARRGVEPAPERIASARETVGFEGLVLDELTRSARILREGLRLDLGGIAKGYAVDQAFEELAGRGFSVVLVEGGGDLRVGDPPPGTDGWRVARPSPPAARLPGATAAGTDPAWTTAVLSRVAVATSGATYRSLETDDSSRSHVIDPRSGFGVSADRIVSVVAATAMRADGLASALSVLGPGGSEIARALGAIDVAVIDGAGRTIHQEDDDGS